MARDTAIPATDSLQLRDRVQEKLRVVSPRSDRGTLQRMAEKLLLDGWIDVAFIQAEDDRRKAEQEARDKKAAEQLELLKRESGNAGKKTFAVGA